MYDLNWKEHEYAVLYVKAGREIPLHVVISPITAEEMIQYEQSAMRPFTVDRDGGTTTELISKTNLECELFDKHFIRLNGVEMNGTSRETAISKIPAQVKIAVIRRGVGGVQPKTERVEVKSLDELIDNNVTITDEVNGSIHEMQHRMAEPSAEETMKFHRATSGKLKSLPGRRQKELMVLQQFRIYPELYDKLVQGVSGYSFGEQQNPSPESMSAWVNLIPYTHKKIVVQQLFGRAELDEEGE